MALKKYLQAGFTVVELIIVIVVIVVLALLVYATYDGVQKRSRDTDRQNDISHLASQLELYYQDHGYYPLLARLQNASAAKSDMPGIDVEALRVKDQNYTETDTAIAEELSGGADYSHYMYQAIGCEEQGCAKFNLYYNKEQPGNGESNPLKKESFN